MPRGKCAVLLFTFATRAAGAARGRPAHGPPTIIASQAYARAAAGALPSLARSEQFYCLLCQGAAVACAPGALRRVGAPRKHGAGGSRSRPPPRNAKRSRRPPEMAATAESVLKPDFNASRKHFIF